MRSENEVFTELSELCIRRGYAFVLGYICIRDNIIRYSEEGITPDDLSSMHSNVRLLRTEMSTLIGLIVDLHLILTQGLHLKLTHLNGPDYGLI